MKKILFTLIAFISFSFCYSQYSLNDYKYIIVPKQFHFQNEPDEYRLNQLVKFMFKKYDFEAYVEGEPMPEDLKQNYCLALKSDITSKGSFKTKSKITLLDCNNNTVFVSEEGVTKEKEFSKAYNISIRKAFESFEGLNYRYNESSTTKVVKNDVNENEEIEKLKAEIKELKQTKSEESLENNTTDKDMIPVAPEKQITSWKDNFPVYIYKKEKYYLKPGVGGTYMVDGNNKTIFKLQNTTDRNVFILTKGDYKGVAFYKDFSKSYSIQYYNSSKDLKIEDYRLQ